MRTDSASYGMLTIAAAGFFVACGDPASMKPSQPTPSPFTSVEVTGPDSLVAGRSDQLVARIRQADGTTKSATGMSNLGWRSLNPGVVSVNSSGVVTATPWGSGDATITVDIGTSGAVHGTHHILVQPRVTATLDVSQQGTPGQRRYVFSLNLTEPTGVPTRITDLWVDLDDGWGGQCSWTPEDLGETRLPANGTLALGPLICGYERSYSVVVSLGFLDDDGHRTYVFLSRDL